MTIEEMEIKRTLAHETLDRAQDRGEGYEDLAGAYERAFDIVDGLLEEALMKLNQVRAACPQ